MERERDEEKREENGGRKEQKGKEVGKEREKSSRDVTGCSQGGTTGSTSHLAESPPPQLLVNNFV